jgi:hypothetical protein
MSDFPIAVVENVPEISQVKNKTANAPSTATLMFLVEAITLPPICALVLLILWAVYR